MLCTSCPLPLGAISDRYTKPREFALSFCCRDEVAAIHRRFERGKPSGRRLTPFVSRRRSPCLCLRTKLLDSSEGGIAVVFSDEKKWIKKIWRNNQAYIVDQNGNAENFFDDFYIDFPSKFNMSINPPILRIKKQDKYLFIAKRNGDDDYKLWLVSNHEDPSMLFDSGISTTSQFAVSPDERYVATLQENGSDSYRINILSLDSLKLLHSWTFPFKMTTPKFFWSPDSETLALDYSTDPVGVNNGIQIMDIKTGQMKVILKKVLS